MSAEPTVAGSTAPSSTPSATSATKPEPSWSPRPGWTGLEWGTPASAPFNISDIVPGGDGYLAFGSEQVDGVVKAAAYTTKDGQAWRRLYGATGTRAGSSFRAGLPVMDRYVAAGSVGKARCYPPPGEGQECDPAPFALWTSGDLTTWDRITLRPEASGDYWSIAPMPLGASARRVVLAGDTINGKAALWASTGGKTWSSVELPASMDDARFDTMVAGPDGFAIGGFTGGHRPVSSGIYDSGASVPALWRSGDGLSWQQIELPGASALVGNELRWLFAGSDGWIAISNRTTHEAVMWHSLMHGRTWTVLDTTDGRAIPSPIASDGIHILGDEYAGDDAPVAYSVTTGDGTWTPLNATGDTEHQPTGAGDYTADQAFVLPDGVAFLGSGPSGEPLLWFAKAVLGNASAEPSPSPSSPTPSPSTAPLPSESATGYVPLSLTGPPVLVAMPDQWSVRGLDVEGPLAVLAESGAPKATDGRSVALVDFTTGTMRYLPAAPFGWHVWEPRISDGRVAWIELHNERDSGDLGPLDWAIRLYDIASGSTTVVASGTQPDVAGSQAWPPYLAFDGTTVSYAIVDSSRPDDRWKIVLTNADTSTPIRTLHANGHVYGLEMSGPTIGWSERLQDPKTGEALGDATLMLVDGAADARVVAVNPVDAFEFSLAGGLLAWRLPAASTGKLRMWAASAPDFPPQPIGPVPSAQEDGQVFPAADGTLASWTSLRSGDGTASGEDADHLCLWSSQDRVAYEITDEPGAWESAIGSGWLAWTTSADDTVGLKAVPIDQLPISH